MKTQPSPSAERAGGAGSPRYVTLVCFVATLGGLLFG